MKTKLEIIEKVKELYGDYYDCSLVDDTGSRGNVKLICPKHGIFEIRYDHLCEGKGCPKCRREKLLDDRWEDFVKRAREVHGNKYEYIRDDDFVGITSRIRIICPIHGEFTQNGVSHVVAKQGCKKCYDESKIGKYKMTTEEFIRKAKEIHGDRYDYSKTVYNGIKNKLKIICPEHGEFWQVAYDHLRGFKCEQCKYDNNRMTLEEFVQRAEEIHGDKYTYNKVKYVSNNVYVTVTCKKHGDFQTHPAWMLMGMGCPYCKESRMENEVRLRLDQEHIKYELHANKKVLPWIGNKSLDFYLPEYKIAIECQGKQHFVPIKQFGGENKLKIQIESDCEKKRLCEENGIKLLYYTREKNTPYECFRDIEMLIKEIRAAF